MPRPNANPSARRIALDLVLYPKSTFPPLSRANLLATEKAVGAKLPASYLRFLESRNGATPRLRGFCVKARLPKWLTDRPVLDVEEFFGVSSPTHSEAWCSVAGAYLTLRECGVPEGLVPFASQVGGGWLCFDARRGMADPAVVFADSEGGPVVNVAPSFDAFLRGLVRTETEFLFVVTHRKLTDADLDHFMRGLGCIRGRFKHPGTWDWPKFRDGQRKAAYIANHRNDASGHGRLFPDLPASTPILHIDVSEKDQSECIRTLAAAFGSLGELRHQPVDRPHVNLQGLKPVEIKAVRRVPPRPFAPMEAHMALWNGDLVAVQRFLALGLNPNRRHSTDTRTPLELAALRGHTAMLKALLKAHAGTGPLKGDPLGAALVAGQVGTAKLLLSAGAKPTLKNLRETALWLRPAPVRLILEHGVAVPKGLRRQVEEMTVDADNPKDLAKSRRDQATVARLLARAEQAA